MNIRLCVMTQALCREYHQNFAYDPDIFTDQAQIPAYIYSPDRADAHWLRQKTRNRIHLAIILANQVIGEIVFKHIDVKAKTCTLSIHMVNDSVKNKGYGTEAEKLALGYVFCESGMETVFADALLKNTRSQHVLKKVGFTEIGRDEVFHYYSYRKADWMDRNLQSRL